MHVGINENDTVINEDMMLTALNEHVASEQQQQQQQHYHVACDLVHTKRLMMSGWRIVPTVE